MMIREVPGKEARKYFVAGRRSALGREANRTRFAC